VSQAEQRKSSLLSYVTSVQVPGIKRFVAADAFGPNNPAGIKFRLSNIFQWLFLGRFVRGVEPETIEIYRLEKRAWYLEIRANCPGDYLIELAHFYKLIEAQANGEKGLLLVDGQVNIAYVENDEEAPWTVCAAWNLLNCEWQVGACPIFSLGEWDRGSRVLSRKPA
jgi:hypothetical protein